MRGNIQRKDLYTAENTNWKQLSEILEFVMKHKNFRRVLDNEWGQYKQAVKSKKFDKYKVNRIWRNFFLFTEEMQRLLKNHKKRKVLDIYLAQIKKAHLILISRLYILYSI